MNCDRLSTYFWSLLLIPLSFSDCVTNTCGHARMVSSVPVINNSSVWDEDAALQFDFLAYVIRSVNWRSIVIISDETNDISVELFASQLIDDQKIATTLFEIPDGMPVSYNVAEWYNHSIATAVNMFPNFLVLGKFHFVQEVFAEFSRVAESKLLSFHWLTTLSYDHREHFFDVAKIFNNVAVITPTSQNQLILETLLRQGNAVNIVFVAEWFPRMNTLKPHLTEEHVFPNPKYGLGGRTLRMATLPYAPFVLRHQNESAPWYTGFCIDILNLLAQGLNFTYVISEPSDNSYGQRLPNGTWDGLIGMLLNKKADFALAALSVTPERAAVTDYTVGFYHSNIVMITTFPNPTPMAWTFFLRPFHWLVYLVLGCCLVVMTGISVYIQRQNAKLNNYNHLTEDRKSISSCVIEVMEILFGSLLGRAVIYEVTSTSGKILQCSWLLLSLVTVAAYTGKLTSISVITKQPVPFSTIGELVRRSDYRWGFVEGSYIESILSSSSNRDYQLYYKKVQEFEKKDPNVVSPNATVSLKNILGGHFVELTTSSLYDFFKSDNCELAVAQQKLLQDTMVVHLQKGSPYTDLFNTILNRASDQGILQYLTYKWFPERAGCQDNKKAVLSVSLDMTYSSFIMAVAGVCLAFLLLVRERCKHCAGGGLTSRTPAN